MFTSIATAATGIVTFLSIVVLGQSVTVHHSTRQSSPSPTPHTSPTPTPSPTKSDEEIRVEIQDRLDQEKADAKEHINQQRQEAINQVNEDFDDAMARVEEAKAGLPAAHADALDRMEQQLEEHRQQELGHQIPSTTCPQSCYRTSGS